MFNYKIYAIMEIQDLEFTTNRLVFGQLSGSMGNITAVRKGDCYYLRKKGNCQCPDTERQQDSQQRMKRANMAWRNLPQEQQDIWNELGRHTSPHSWPYGDGSYRSGRSLFLGCYLKLAAIGREGIPETVPTIPPPAAVLKLDSLSEFECGRNLCVECTSDPVLPQGLCITARIRVHAEGNKCNSGFKASCLGRSDDGRHVTFTVPDYRQQFKIKDMKDKRVSIRIEYDLTDMRSGRWWKPEHTVSRQFISNDGVISQSFR